MKWQDAVVVGATALATAAAALALLGTGLAVAKEGQGQEIAWPVWRGQGCEITLRTGQATYQPGETPVVELLVVNRTSSPVTLEATLAMMSQPVADMRSRRMPASQKTWEHKCLLSLHPGESRQPFPTATAVAGGTTVTFVLRIGEAGVATRPLAIAGPAPSLPSRPARNAR